LAWRAVALPVDPRGRDVIRAVAACGGRWYVAGGILSPTGTTAPALWASSDGTSFTALPIQPRSAYGPSHVLSTVACRRGDVVAVGASNGGAHGNPRTNTWHATGSGPLVEAPFVFTRFGGPDAVGVGPIAGGPAGYLIAGTRVDATGGAGAAVWPSVDGRDFTLVDADPALESGARGNTEANGAAVLAHGFVVVGAVTPPASRLAARDPLVWRSSDGRHWQRIMLPATPADNPLQRVTSTPTGLLAAGTDSTRFAVWTADPTGATWRRSAYFGATAPGPSVPMVTSLVAGSEIGGTGPTTAYAVVSDGASFQLWRGTASAWQLIVLPEAVPAAPVASGPRVVAATASEGQLMLGIDDGTAAHVWFTAG
jgi:hypothetical protein